jgi:hypothetical protein
MVARANLGFALNRLPHAVRPSSVFDQLPTLTKSAEWDTFDVTRHRGAIIRFLDEIELLAGLFKLRGSFWAELIRAAEQLELDDRMPRYRARYREALQRVSMEPFDEP